jgi:hypothetical protein
MSKTVRHSEKGINMSDCGFCGLPLRDQFGVPAIVWEVLVCEACIELAEICWEPETV